MYLVFTDIIDTWWLTQITPGLSENSLIWNKCKVSQCHSVVCSSWYIMMELCPQHRFRFLKYILVLRGSQHIFSCLLSSRYLFVDNVCHVGTGLGVSALQDWSRDCDVWQLGGRHSPQSRVSSHSVIMMLVRRHHLSVFLISSRTLGCLVNKPTISIHPTTF